MGFVFYFIGMLLITIHQAWNKVPANTLNVLLILGAILGFSLGSALIFGGLK